MAQQLPSGSTTASGLASTLLKLTQQCSTNSRPPGYRAARRVKISIVGNLRTRILSSHEVMDSMKRCDVEYMLQRVTGTFIVRITNHPTTQTRSHSLAPKLKLEEYLKIAFYNRNIFVIL